MKGARQYGMPVRPFPFDTDLIMTIVLQQPR